MSSLKRRRGWLLYRVLGRNLCFTIKVLLHLGSFIHALNFGFFVNLAYLACNNVYVLNTFAYTYTNLNRVITFSFYLFVHFILGVTVHQRHAS